MLKIYNTMSRQIEEFHPIEEGKVKMYVCGPTVYNYIHIGNARSVVAFDVIRKYMEYRELEVNYISNFTDVDDKIINAAKSEGVAPSELSERFIKAFYEDVAALNVKKATANPKATEFIEEMIVFIQDLIDKGFAYESNGDIYFRVAKSENYARLANKNLTELLEGASGRTDDETSRKESPADFALWKSAKVGEISWKTPWGAGRPGWHIECSVMSSELLGDTLDIHGGGADLEFPHHTNEIAQSEAHTGKTFANVWMHNGFVNVDGEKMSKSLGNFKTVHEMLEAGINPQVLRFFLATTHYRRPVDFTDDALVAAENNLKKIENTYRRLKAFLKNKSTEQSLEEGELTLEEYLKPSFEKAMDNDFDIANALTVLYKYIGFINIYLDADDKGEESNAKHLGEKELIFFDEVLNILGINFEEEASLDAAIETLIAERQEARANRDFAKSDEIRDQLKAQGIVLEDTKDGVRWHRE